MRSEVSIRLEHLAVDSRRVMLAGDWTVDTRPDVSIVLSEIDTSTGVRCLSFDVSALGRWDSYLLVALERLHRVSVARGVEFDIAGLPTGVRGLLKLAWAVPERAGARRGADKQRSFVERLGSHTLSKVGEFRAATRFAGELAIGLTRMAVGKAHCRRTDVALFMQEAGAEALSIVALISVLVGTILAFVGAIQLKLFGAEIFVANLVGAGMAVEMGALMTAIIMAGRTGASYAAQLGTMQVNEEIDALQTMGISPFEFLVLPRVVALVLMMPLLCLYADILGMLGGAAVCIGLMGIEPVQYYMQTAGAVTLPFFAQGLIKSAVFGVVVAFCGSLQGMRCGRSAQAVGEATTKAVVQCIIWIVIMDAILTLIYMQTGFGS